MNWNAMGAIGEVLGAIAVMWMWNLRKQLYNHDFRQFVDSVETREYTTS